MDRRTSEWVSPGHPDKVADFVASYLLDRYLERDAASRVALECQSKDNHVTLGGEVTSTHSMPEGELRRHVRDAICALGYTPEYAAEWGAENCIDPDALDVTRRSDPRHVRQGHRVAVQVHDAGRAVDEDTCVNV